MIHLDRITLREIRLRLREPFRISSGVVEERRILLLELHDASGALEWSECVAGEWPNYSSETIDTAWLAIREWLAQRVVGKAIGSPEAVHDILERNVCGHNMAKAAIEMGCYGIAARQAGVSLATLIGGQRDRVVTGISIGIQRDPDALVHRALKAVSDGYRKIKVKIQPGADVDYVRAVREALPAGTDIMADANSAYAPDDADHLLQLDRFNLIMIEQPLNRDDLVRHAELQRRMKTPICLDESITDVARCEDMIALKSGRIVNIKPGRVGGFTVARRIHDVCAQHGIPVWCGGMLESGIGRAYNVALASLPNFRLPGDLSPSARYWERDVVTPEWTMDAAGEVRVPRREPGIGVSVDRDRVENLTVRREEIRVAPAA
ncbi:MAG TPA: o-succinylbenzoate synthase [Gemmatimonadaceae bacterium]|nr:o-succinylbenzoate synthase [Gemmatimonadaceae bacterium]